jgi:AAA+ ATPase superfamily predicted ATPase
LKIDWKQNQNVVIYGQSGAGKTHFANEITQRLKNINKIVYFLDCASEKRNLKTIRRAFNHSFRLSDIENIEAFEMDFEEDFDYSELSENVSKNIEESILILDNFEIKIISDSLKHLLNRCSTIILSRSRKLIFQQEFKLDCFSYFQMKTSQKRCYRLCHRICFESS